MKNKLQLQQGFTYLELIVVISIFAILSVIIAYIFLLYNQVQNEAKITQRIVGNQRFIMEVMVREIRMAEIDYNSYASPVTNPQQVLYLRDPDDNILTFEKVTSGCPTGVTSCVQVTKGTNTAIISADDVNVNHLTFYINPEYDPNVISAGSYLADEQHLVTISLEIESVDDPEIIIPIQSSASSKRYKR